MHLAPMPSTAPATAGTAKNSPGNRLAPRAATWLLLLATFAPAATPSETAGPEAGPTALPVSTDPASAPLEPAAPAAVASVRPAAWATPLTLSGVGNLHRVSDSLYRSEQPSRHGMRRLVDSLGVRTVINLRKFHSDRRRVRGTSLRLHELDINTWEIDDSDVIRALRIIRWEGQGPYLVHCQHGADRTGTVNAMYRMAFQGWSREEAIREMVEGGYGFHALWKNILRYLQNVDIGKIRAAVEAPPPPRTAQAGRR